MEPCCHRRCACGRTTAIGITAIRITHHRLQNALLFFAKRVECCCGFAERVECSAARVHRMLTLSHLVCTGDCC